MTQVERLMEKLDISKEDAEKLIIYDKMVDQIIAISTCHQRTVLINFKKTTQDK